MFKIAATISLLFLSGCTTPPKNLRETGERFVFESEQQPSTTFRIITEGVRGCYAKRHVTADFFPDNQTGMVSMSVLSTYSSTAVFLADIAPSKTGTVVTVSYVGNDAFPKAIKSWAAGDFLPCPYGS